MPEGIYYSCISMYVYVYVCMCISMYKYYIEKEAGISDVSAHTTLLPLTYKYKPL